MQRLCQKYHKTPAQIALRWLIEQQNVVAITKMSNPIHMQENLGTSGWSMDKNDSIYLTFHYPCQQKKIVSFSSMRSMIKRAFILQKKQTPVLIVRNVIDKMKRALRAFLQTAKLTRLYISIRTFQKDIFLQQRLTAMKKLGTILPPYNIVLETNLTCNLRCYFCYQREIHTIRQNLLTPEDIRKSFSSIHPHNINEVMLIGGEIFVRPDIFKVFDVFEELQFPFSITTNGTLFYKDRVKKLLSYRMLRAISFSIHGIGKTHDEIVGQIGAFAKAYEAMKNIANRGIIVVLNIVITQKNYKQLKDIVDLAKELRINEILIIFEYSIGIFDYLKEKKNGSKHDFKTYEIHSKKIKHDIIQKVQEMRNYAKEKNVYISDQTKISKDEPNLFINKKILKYKNKLYLACKELLNIRFDPEGKLIYCFLARSDFGSLREKSFEELINSEHIRSIRKKRANGSFIPSCEGCCKLEKIF